MDGNNQRPHGDSGMQSHAPNKQSSSTPLRAAVARPENQEFNVAGEDFGGLPLDKAVKDSIRSRKKGPEPVNHSDENLEHHVDVPLKKPTQTVFRSMGGRRNTPTNIGWGGPEGNMAKYDTTKDFVYCDKDFPRPRSANDPSPSDPSASKPEEGAFSPSKIISSNNRKLSPTAKPHGIEAAPYLGLSHSFFRKTSANKDDKPSTEGTPSMNLDRLLPENAATIPQQRKQPQPNQNQTLSKKSSFGVDAPELGLDKLFPEDFSDRVILSAQQAPSRESLNAPAHLLSSPGDAPSKRSSGVSDTPNMTLDNFFRDKQSPSELEKSAPSSLRDTSTPQDTPEMNLGNLFKEQPAAVTQLLPGRTHLVPAHRPKKDSDKSDENAHNYDPFEYHLHMRQPHEPHHLVPQHQSNKWSKLVNQQGTPEKNLGSLFPDNSPSEFSQPREPSSPPKGTPTNQDTTEMNLNNLFLESHLSSQSKNNASSSLSTLPRQDTPKIFSKFFPEDQSSSQPKKKPLSTLERTTTHQDTSEMRLNKLFPEDSSNKATITAQHAPSHEPFKARAHLTHHSGEQFPVGSGTPEMNSDMLFLENFDKAPAQPKRNASSPLKSTLTRQDTPEMNLDKLFLESQSYQLKKNESSLRKDTPTRQDTPEMNLNNLFCEDQSPSQLKNASSTLKGTLTRQDTPELNLKSLIPENQFPSLPSKNASSPLKNIPIRQETPEMNLNTFFLENQSPSQSPSQPEKSTSSSLESPLTRQDTPEMNLDKFFLEDRHVLAANAPVDHPTSVHFSLGTSQPLSSDSSKPLSISLEDLLDYSDASGHSPYDSPMDTEAMPFGQPSSHNAAPSEPAAHPDEKDAHAPDHSTAGKIKLPSMSHRPAMPSIGMQVFSANKAGAPAQHELPSVSAPQLPSVSAPLISTAKLSPLKTPPASTYEPPTLSAPLAIVPLLPTLSHSLVNSPQFPSVSAPLISTPKLSTLKTSSASTHEPPTLIAPLAIAPLLPTLSHSPVSGLELPSAPSPPTVPNPPIVPTPHLGGILGIVPSMSLMSSSRHPPLIPEEDAGFLRGDTLRHELLSPSNIGDVAEVYKVSFKPRPVVVFRADIPKDEKKPGKRARKAQRKHDAAQRHSIMDTISTALVGRKKNSVSSPVMKLNELFDETIPAPTASAAPLLGGIRGRLTTVWMPSLSSVHMPTMPAVPSVHMPSMPAMPTLPSVHLPALPEVHLPALALPQLPKLSSSAVRDISSVAVTLPKPKPSTAAAIKLPKIDVTLLPEEQANYPRGDIRRRENPAPSHVESIVEVKELVLPGALPSLSVLPTLKLRSVSTHDATAEPVKLSKHMPSKAAAIKMPKVDVTLLPEEQANYPRGDIRRRENPAPSHVEDIVEVKKLHLPADFPVLKLGSTAVHDVSSVTVPLPRHRHSKAAAVKVPKIDLTLLPEEQANYPRGDIQRRENPAPSHVEDIVEVKKLRFPAPLPLDAELPVVAAAAAAISMSSIHMPTLPSMHLPSLPSVSLPSVMMPTFPEVHLPEFHMPTLPAMPAMPTLPKISIPSEGENYYSAGDEPVTPIIPRKTVVTEPARVIPKIAAPVPEPIEVVAPTVAQKTTTVVTETAARVVPKVASVAAPTMVAVPVIAQKAAVTEPTRVIPKVKMIPITQPPVDVMKTSIPQPPSEAKKIHVAQPPVKVVKMVPIALPPGEIKKIPIAQPPIETKKILIAQPPVVTKSTTVKTTTLAAPASVVSKIEVSKPVVQEAKEVKVMTAPNTEPNVRKPSSAELYVNEHHQTKVVKPKVDDFKLTESIAHAPQPAIPAVIETKKVVETRAPKIAETPKPIIVETNKVVESPNSIQAEVHKVVEAPKHILVETHKVVETEKVTQGPKIIKASSPAPTPAPRPEPITTKTNATTSENADPIPTPRPVVPAAAVAAVAPIVHHFHHYKEDVAPATAQTEERKHDIAMVTKTADVEPTPQPIQQIKKVVEEARHHEPIPQPVQVQQIKSVAEEHHHQPQPQIQQQQTIQQQSVAATPVEALLDSGERVVLVKKLYTTVEYYHPEDDDELDEYGYRKDRDVSLHMGPMPTAESRRNSLQAYRKRKTSGLSRLDADIAALHHQDVINGRRSSLADPLQQQHPYFYGQTPQGTNQQPYSMQTPLRDLHRQHQQYQVVQQQVYNTQPRNSQQQQQYMHQQQEQHSAQPRVQQQQQQYYQNQNHNLSQQQQQQHLSQNQPIYQSQQAYQQSQLQEQMQKEQQQRGVRFGGEYSRGPAQ
ncbi:hypothetical protein BGZ96_007993 [Linnemannia gamsii]|uniref:Uncharacterized protein n=1 Tax=Linnemannia gamsii TaxID=64522 RepID=A0ABQ7JZV8_9FUNG|nr:hypothetical protein BGZ96_007993 [Linnemannia gamsii]